MTAVLPKQSHIVTPAEHEAFARLSGDHNPLHLDALYARRLMFGGCVTHGVHLLLRALETYAQTHEDVGALGRLGARFFSATHPGEAVQVEMQTDRDNHSGIVVTDVHRRVVAKVQAEWSGLRPASISLLSHAPPQGNACERLSDAGIANGGGSFPLFLDPSAAAYLFPRLSSALPATQLAAILGTTYVIGMRLPGHDSIFSSLNLSFTDTLTADHPDLVYKTQNFSAERRFCRIAVSSPGMSGFLEAFVRPAPAVQPSFSGIQALIEPDLFAGQHALVVGGSRGLGEVCAKLLAAGQAHVTLTYREGAVDARRVVAELADAGASAGALRLDARDAEFPELAAFLSSGGRITDLYYFATPPIFTETRQFAYTAFLEFSDIYIHALARLFEMLSGPSNDGWLRGVWLPSSVAVDTRPEDMTAYIMAKQAMEYLATDWSRKYPRIHFAAPRLPRLTTDQTVTLSPVPAEEPAPVLAGLLQSFAKGRHTS